MKLTAFFLMILVMLNGVFYCVYFHASIIHARTDSRETIAHTVGNTQFTIVKISASQNDLFSHDEMWLNDQLYDIAKKEVIGDSIVVYLYHDTEEEGAMAFLDNFFDTDDNCFVCAMHNCTILRNIHRIPINQLIFNAIPSLITYNFFFRQNSLIKINIAGTVSQVPTPPPRNY